MQQQSIFEPLYSQAPPAMELPAVHSLHQTASWFSGSTPSSSLHFPKPDISCSPDLASLSCNTMPTELIITSNDCDHELIASHYGKLSSSSSKASIGRAHASMCSMVKGHDRKDVDDGSVASKLLSSITKSISSPSLLASCKESPRQTPYQKILKLKKMKLQHCAEELGAESSDTSSYFYDAQSTYQVDMIGKPSIVPPASTFSNAHETSEIFTVNPLTSVKSVPNLCTSTSISGTTNHSNKYMMRSRSFPPPLSHTLPASSSCDSFSLSLCPLREDGRFILKEVRVPSKQYFQANRKDGRLTLRVVMREDAGEENHDQEEETNNVGESLITSDEVLAQEKETVLPEKKEGNTREKVEECQILDKKELGSSNIVESLDEELSSVVNNNVHIVKVGMPGFNIEEYGKGHMMHTLMSITLFKASTPPQLLSPPLLSKLEPSHLLPPRNTHILPSSHHDMSTLILKSTENFVWKSNVLRPLSPSGVGSGGGDDSRTTGFTSSAFASEAANIKKLIVKVVSELATSFCSEASYARGKWCLAAGRKKLPSSEVPDAVDSVGNNINVGGYYSAINKIMMNGSTIIDEEKFNHGVDVNLNYSNYDEGRGSFLEDDKLECLEPPLCFNVQLPLQSDLQCSEWSHTLHCKEPFDRQQLGKNFMKPLYII